MVELVEDGGFSAKNLKRPGIEHVLSLLGSGQAQALVVAKLDRLSRSLLDFAGLIEQGRKDGWALVALDIGLDSTTANGEMLAGMLAVFAQWERRLIGQRTREALAVKRSQGVTLGRPRTMPTKLVARMRRMHKGGASYAGIAATLTAEGVPTAHGGQRWHASTVRKAILA